MALSSSPADPPASTTTTAAVATTTTPRLFTTAPPPSRPPTSPFPQPQPHYHHHHHHRPHLAATYPQLQPPLYAAQTLPHLAPRLPATAIHHQSAAAKPHESPSGILYPVASSGRGFLPRGVRPQSAAQTVTISNHGGFPPRPVVGSAYPHTVQAFGFPQSDHVHLIRPSHLQHNFIGSSGGVVTGTAKVVPVSSHSKVPPSQYLVSDGNGYEDQRDRSRDDSLVTVRDRKVRICEGSSLYALCRSWLKNGFPEESQPQYVDGVKLLPKPSSTPVADTKIPSKKEGDKEEEEEEEKSVENLSPKDLLQRHVKRAKRVRARLREERLLRIARYKTRLALLLPPLVEQQQFTNDTAASN